MRLKDKVAIVTGASGGLGLAIAKRYVAEGARVAIADVRDPQSAAAALAADGQVLSIVADVADERSVNSMVQATVERFGRVDILVNNAAVSSTLPLQPFEKIGVEEWRRVMDVNLMGTFLCCKSVVTHMRRQKAGRIINFTSGTIYRGTPFNLHYVASKGAIMVLTRSLASELGADNILVNAIAPGFTLTEGMVNNASYSPEFLKMVVASRALKRAEYAEDIVGTATFLASDDSSFITGQVLSVDGGATFH
jgi:NAD(P)-dependent dehydrogenase (short-subunit alcohol dehydrogenase family)